MSVTGRKQLKNQRKPKRKDQKKKQENADVGVTLKAPISASRMGELAEFLNFDFTPEGTPWQVPDHPLFQLLFETRRRLSNEGIEALQAEVRKDLMPIVAPKRLADLDLDLEKLLKKANDLRLINQWDILPYDAQ